MDEGKLTVSQLTLEALARTLKSEVPLPLKSSAKKPGLLPGGPTTTAKKEATAECLSDALGLFQKSGPEKEPLVRITEAGIRMLFAQSTPARRKELLANAAQPFKEMAQAVATALAVEELRDLNTKQAELTRTSKELRAQLAQMIESRLSSVEAELKALNAEASELKAQATKHQEANKQTPDPAPQSTAPVQPDPKPQPERRVERPRPETEDDINFQRDLCRALALEWKDTPDARETLERVMFNSGLEQVGELDEVVSFDAGQQELLSGSAALPGHQVKVVEPGWKFESPRGVLLIVKPMVVPVAT